MVNIVGNGLIATAFKNNIEENNYSDWIIFASGVSNSQDDDEDSFSRENKLLKKLSANKRIVYFSTCSVNIPKEYHTRYIKHKLEIENMFNLKKDLVIRLSNVVGENGNRKNIVNYFIESIKNHQLINLQKNAERNLKQNEVKLFGIEYTMDPQKVFWTKRNEDNYEGIALPKTKGVWSR